MEAETLVTQASWRLSGLANDLFLIQRLRVQILQKLYLCLCRQRTRSWLYVWCWSTTRHYWYGIGIPHRATCRSSTIDLTSWNTKMCASITPGYLQNVRTQWNFPLLWCNLTEKTFNYIRTNKCSSCQCPTYAHYAHLCLLPPSQKRLFRGALVCPFVCPFVNNITQKVVNGLQWNFMEGSGVVQERTDLIL